MIQTAANAVRKRKVLSLGVVIAALGAVQVAAPQLQTLLPPVWYAVGMMVLGVAVAVCGVLKTQAESNAE